MRDVPLFVEHCEAVAAKIDIKGDSPDRLRQVFDTLCQRLEFMCATLEAENDYRQIFRAMWRLSPQFLAAI